MEEQNTAEVIESTETTEELSAEEELNNELDEIYQNATTEKESETEEKLPDSKANNSVGQPVQTEQPKPNPYPTSWGKDLQGTFEQLPPDIQAQIIKREGERERVVQQAFAAQNVARAMEPITRGIKDLQGYFESFSDATGRPLWGNAEAMAKEISDVLRVKQLLCTDPQAGVQAIDQWLKAAGIVAPDGQQQDTEKLAMQRRIAQLENANKQREAQEANYRAQMQQQQAVQQIAGVLDNFGSSKEADGSATYPLLQGEHAEKIGLVMGQWMRANMGQDGITPELFKQAYETAVFSVPETREMEFKRREDARVAQFKERSDRARKAAGLNPRPGRAHETEPARPVEQVFEDIWKKYNG